MEICTIGGYEEVGKNMTAVKIGDDVFVFDIGFFLPGVIELQEDPSKEYTLRGLRRVGAVPDDKILDDLKWKEKVKAIFLSHAHLDHVGGVPYLADRYPNATIYGSPFTIAVLNSLIEDAHIHLSNQIKIVQPNSKHIISNVTKKINVEFVHATHSTIDCTYIVLHSEEGSFFYALDLKFDNYPTMGEPPNYERIKEIGKGKVKVLIVDALYSGTEKRPGGEKVADHLLEEAFLDVGNYTNSAIFVTTFSSHIERLNNIVKHAKKTGRQIIFLGRSLAKYVECAEKVGKCPFRKEINLIKYKGQINSILNKIEKNRERYLVVCTGHQGEKGSILDRISKNETPFRFRNGDNLIFSSSIIPTEVNVIARKKLDEKLRKIGVRLQIDVHVHGHGSRKDMRDLLEMLKPEHVIPAHGTIEQETPLIDLAKEFNYHLGKTVHLSSNGKLLEF